MSTFVDVGIIGGMWDVWVTRRNKWWVKVLTHPACHLQDEDRFAEPPTTIITSHYLHFSLILAQLSFICPLIPHRHNTHLVTRIFHRSRTLCAAIHAAKTINYAQNAVIISDLFRPDLHITHECGRRKRANYGHIRTACDDVYFSWQIGNLSRI